jgi:hypothetical protein
VPREVLAGLHAGEVDEAVLGLELFAQRAVADHDTAEIRHPLAHLAEALHGEGQVLLRRHPADDECDR